MPDGPQLEGASLDKPVLTTDPLPDGSPAVVEDLKPEGVEAPVVNGESQESSLFESLVGELKKGFDEKLEAATSALLKRDEEYQKVSDERDALRAKMTKLILHEGAVFTSGDKGSEGPTAHMPKEVTSFEQLAQLYNTKG